MSLTFLRRLFLFFQRAHYHLLSGFYINLLSGQSWVNIFYSSTSSLLQSCLKVTLWWINILVGIFELLTLGNAIDLSLAVDYYLHTDLMWRLDVDQNQTSVKLRKWSWYWMEVNIRQLHGIITRQMAVPRESLQCRPASCHAIFAVERGVLACHASVIVAILA